MTDPSTLPLRQTDPEEIKQVTDNAETIKLAYGSIPKDCGTFTFYRNLRDSLRPHGIEIFCVTVGRQEAMHWNDAFADDHCVLLAPGVANRRRQAKAFADWVGRERVHLVMPINSTALLSALPHLPGGAQVVMRCANAFDHGYRITVLGQEYTACIVATTPRHQLDLVTLHGADPRKLCLIPHGIDPAPYDRLPVRSRRPLLTLGYLGRLEHNQKGALYLPGIVRRLESIGLPFRLKIAGAGEHRRAMEKLMAHAIERGSVEFTGRLTPQEIPEFFAGVDVFLFPSRFEGFGFSLVEAMMAGSVPVVSRIAGITDYIVDDGVTGLLCDIGDESAFASAITRLHGDRPLLERLGTAAASVARKRFTSARMGADYERLFRHLVASPVPKAPTVAWSQFRLPRLLRQTWRNRCPKPLRKFARACFRIVMPALRLMSRSWACHETGIL